MARFNLDRRNWSIDIRQDWIDVTSERETPNESWRFTDANGHEHHYEHGYPTLDLVIDESHWCDGTEGIYNHDPHEEIDAAHYECKQCGEVIKPEMDPPHRPKQIPGMRHVTITVKRHGANYVETLTIHPTGEEMAAIEAAESPEDAIQAFVDAYPSDRASRSDMVIGG